jgi:hypothetical protein
VAVLTEPDHRLLVEVEANADGRQRDAVRRGGFCEVHELVAIPDAFVGLPVGDQHHPLHAGGRERRALELGRGARDPTRGAGAAFIGDPIDRFERFSLVVLGRLAHLDDELVAIGERHDRERIVVGERRHECARGGLCILERLAVHRARAIEHDRERDVRAAKLGCSGHRDRHGDVLVAGLDGGRCQRCAEDVATHLGVDRTGRFALL